MRKWTERENGDREMKWRERGEMETEQGGRGWLAFGDRSEIPQSFRRVRIFKVYNCGKTCNLWL